MLLPATMSLKTLPSHVRDYLTAFESLNLASSDAGPRIPNSAPRTELVYRKNYRWDDFKHQAIRIEYALIVGKKIDDSDSKRYQRAAKKLEKMGLIQRVAHYGVSRPSHFQLTDFGRQHLESLDNEVLK